MVVNSLFITIYVVSVSFLNHYFSLLLTLTSRINKRGINYFSKIKTVLDFASSKGNTETSTDLKADPNLCTINGNCLYIHVVESI